MKIIPLLLAVLCVYNSANAQDNVMLSTPGCGKRPNLADEAPFIRGGFDAEINPWPWMAAINVKRSNQDIYYMCGGSLITSQHVLTSAHCFHGSSRPISDYTIILGSHHRKMENSNDEPEDEGTVTTTPLSIKIHEDFDTKSFDSDLAIITLDTDIPMTDRIRPICLPTSSKLENPRYVTVIGWGNKEFGGQPSETLKEITLRTVNSSYCNKVYERIANIRITKNMLCAGGLSSNEDACTGDGGGPLMAKDVKDSKWIQVGIVSFGLQCGVVGYPGVYTKVANFVPWIEKQISI